MSFASDTRLRRRYRRLQSWYRQEVLHQPYGLDRLGRPIGNLLAAEAVENDPTLNFLRDPMIAAYVDQRIPDVRRAKGALDEDRVRRNMLSSQPLCFNMFGYLRGNDAFASLLGRLLSMDIASVDQAECEWAPDPAFHLQDRTAFDGFVAFRTASGDKRFVGIETKYTDSFSPKPYPPERYKRPSDELGWFRGAAPALSVPSTNQLWRNALLAASVEREGAYGQGTSVVLTLEEDSSARRAVERVRSFMTDPGRLVLLTYEQVVAEAEALPPLADWASRFSERYLHPERMDQS